MVVAITGAGGFIGSELVARLSSRHSILALKRRTQGNSSPNVTEKVFELNDPSTLAAIDGADVLVHCAFIRGDKASSGAYKTNVETALAIAERCRQKNIFYVFLSTMSAHADAISDYGRHKFEIEAQLQGPGVCILKLGLVLGSSGGLFNAIRQTILKSSIIPLISGGRQPIQVIHISDLSALVEKVVNEKIEGTFSVASPKVYEMKYLYAQIAKAEKKAPRFISMPYGLMKVGLQVAEAFRLPTPVTVENLKGLKQLKAFDTKSDLERLGVTLMGLEEALEIRD